VKPSATLDVSHLPSVAFGSRDPLWWGVIGLILIEATILGIGMVSYLYLRTLAAVWPPPPTALPDLLLPTVNTLLMLVSVVPMYWVDRAARRKERRGVQIGLVLCVILGLGFSVLRIFEFRAVHTQWDSHAYGSVVWTLLGLHTFDLVAEMLETILLLAVVLTGPMTDHVFLDISDSAPFWYFVAAIWVPIYAVLYLVPRVL
jgi:cytochrome c oxidase subunit I+III